MQGDTQAALDFLQKWEVIGPWVLTAISTDKKSIITKSFKEDDLEEIGPWIDQYNGNRNIYFNVNPSRILMDKKSERANVEALAWLHVDIDPRVGEDHDKERERALGLLQNPPAGIPEPTVIIDSGGGYQGFWALESPFAIAGLAENYEEAARYNKQLEIVFHADNCHNVDRIMRLPGTVNVPDKRKAAKGRVPALAKLVSFDEENVYPLTAFKQSPRTSQIGGGGSLQSAPRNNVTLTTTVPRLDSVDDLDEWSVKDRIKVIVVNGRDPDNLKTKDDSRSAWLFDCLCGLTRAGVPDETVMAILLDPDFKISESVLEQGAEAENFALRQLGRAKEHVEEPLLQELNDRHAVVESLAGKCVTIEEVQEPVAEGKWRSRLVVQSFADFKNRYMNRSVIVGQKKDGSEVTESAGVWWLKSPHRRQYHGLTFAPGRDVEGFYNLWRGFAVQAVPGDCSMYLTHLRDVICKGNEQHFEYLIGWMARAVQFPDSPGQVAVVLRGAQGTGKSFFAKVFGQLFGRHFLQVSDPKHLVGSFNAHLRDCVILFGDEAFFAGDKSHESVLKTLITEENMQIERKGFDVEQSPNYTHLIMASNSQWVVPAGANERRFFCLDVGTQFRQNSEHFAEIARQMDNGGREALLDYLLNYDLSNYEVRTVPTTEALRDQKHLTRDPVESWWFGKLVDGHQMGDEPTWRKDIVCDDLMKDFVRWTQEFGIKHRVVPAQIGQFLKRMCPGLSRRQKSVVVTGLNIYQKEVDRHVKKGVWTFPSLETCRKAWDLNIGDEVWPEDSKPKTVAAYPEDSIEDVM
jgi:hypothetical protein